LLVALHLVFGQAHDSGIRSIGWFLELSRLDRFIAPSYGSQQKMASQVEQLIGRCQKADESKRLLDLSASILARARSPDRPFGKLPKLTRMEMEKQAQNAADVFQRSSSCVEGRNGQLSLRHHGLRELTASKLRALRTIHN